MIQRPKMHHVIEDDFNLQLEIFLIADIQRLGDIKPTRTLSFHQTQQIAAVVTQLQ